MSSPRPNHLILGSNPQTSVNPINLKLCESPKNITLEKFSKFEALDWNVKISPIYVRIHCFQFELSVYCEKSRLLLYNNILNLCHQIFVALPKCVIQRFVNAPHHLGLVWHNWLIINIDIFKAEILKILWL